MIRKPSGSCGTYRKNLRVLLGTLFLLAMAFGPPMGATARAETKPLIPTECDIQLFKDITNDKEHIENHLFVLDIVTRDNYDQMRRSVDTSWDGVYGFFTGNYDEFNVKRENYRKELRYNIDQEYSRDYALTKLTDNGLLAYNLCVNREQPNLSLVLSRYNNLSVDKLVTFNATLKADVSLAGKLLIDIAGAEKVVSQLPSGVIVKADDNGVHISADQPKGSLIFTLQRKSPKEEFRATGQMAGVSSEPLLVGPVLTPKIVDIVTEIQKSGSFSYLARRLENGSNDWVYSIKGGSSGLTKGFKTNACICASRKTELNLPPGQAGRCVDPTDPEQASLVPGSEQLQPSYYLKDFPCGGLPQSAAKRSIATSVEICYEFTASLNAPDQWGQSFECDVDWTVVGKLKEKRTIFVSQ